MLAKKRKNKKIRRKKLIIGARKEAEINEFKKVLTEQYKLINTLNNLLEKNG